ncbi:plasmid pRiA4b ORF-3 family protein [Pseudanabaena sp. FACHB-2040]|nr:plasmid pRiA4b ORF-3 family protein [Pseudanabaena sp. FACHB-2040]
MQEKFDRITAITDEFAQQHLNDEYAVLIRQATAALCRKRPSPLASGKEKTWACGITHAIGMVNFLYDPAQTPHIKAKDLCEWFGVGVSTGQSKSKQVRDSLDMHKLHPDWCVSSLVEQNPLAWIISVDEMAVDARTAPREVQVALAAAGLIPYVPGEAADSEASEAEASAPPTETTSRSADTLYVLQVNLIDGPMTDDFIDDNPQVSRTIEIRGGQTLKDLHHAIFKAFDREEEHMYEFQVGGQFANDPDARRYGLKQAFSNALSGDTPDGEVSKTSINDLRLAVDEMFAYWFDFGDEWWHAIAVIEIKDKAGKGKYPRMTDRIGASPPQYADFE